MLEVIAAMAARTLTAAAVLATAAVVVYAAVRRDRRLRERLAEERAAATSQRLMAGCVLRDLSAFRTRVDLALAERAVVAEADQVVSQALAVHLIDPYDPEGGPAA